MTEETKPDERADGYAVTEMAPTQPAEAVTQDRTPGSGAGERTSPPSRVIGRFRIDAQLGSGGMGDVYRAYDPLLDRAVALKVLRVGGAADGTQGMRRVLREARAAAALTHPNTVTIFEVGEAEGEVFIAMELLEGEDLRAVIERGDASLEDKLRWLLESARALEAAHVRGLVHRDVKPENMFVCRGGALKLLDFGIAKRATDEGDEGAGVGTEGPSSLRTEVGRRVGTPRYMAPEQHAGEATDARTDEYAWALVAFELLTGAHLAAELATRTSEGGAPAPGTSHDERAKCLAELRARVPHLAEPVAEAIARALEPNKEARFSTMAPLVEALARKATSSRAPAPAAAPRPSRRGRWLIAAVVAAAAGAGLTARLARAPLTATTSPSASASAGSTRHACRVEATRSVAVTEADRLAVLPNGQLVIARNFRKGVALERVTPEGSVPVATPPLLASVKFEDDDDLGLFGLTYLGMPALGARFLQGDRGEVLTLFAEDGGVSSQRISGPVTGLVAAQFGKNVALLVTTSVFPARRNQLPSGTEGYLLSEHQVQRSDIESGGLAEGPAIAVGTDGAAAAYLSEREMHLALLDRNLDRVGDVHKVAVTRSYPAVAFAGAAVAVFWSDDSGGKTRLHVASYTPGEIEPMTSRVAIDEPLSPRAPVTAKLPSGDWLVAWVASTGGLSTLRVSQVGPGGALVDPVAIGKGPQVSGLRATTTDKGVSYLWYESQVLARIADVTCTPR